jgi:hypothetical protein
MVRSGFSAGIDAHQRANLVHQVATARLADIGSSYVMRTERMLRGLGDVAKSVDMQRNMKTISGEASRMGFDYRLNGRDNLTADPTLNPNNKAYMDEIHRRFTQLQRSNPDAARAIEDAEKISRNKLIVKVATLTANLMDARAGVARSLAADLERMRPEDATRANLEAQLKTANLESLLADKHSKQLDFQDPSLQQGRNPDSRRYYNAASAELAKRLDAAFADAKTLPPGTPLRDHLGEMEKAYREQVKNNYSSLGRDGDYFVKVGFKNIDAATNIRIQEALKGTNKVLGDLTLGDPYAYFRLDSAGEAQGLHDKLVAAGQGKVVDTAWGLQADHVNDATGVAPAMRGLLNSLQDVVSNTPGLHPDQAALMKSAVERQILSMLPETASRSASMQRRGVPGYDADFVGSFARNTNGAVQDIANLYTSRAYAAAAKMRSDAIEGLNRNGSADARVKAQQVDNEINQRFANSLKPAGNTIVGLTNSLSHSFYLGLSPAFFIRTMAQPWHRGLPIVGSKFGYAGSAKEMFGATPVAMKVIANTLKSAMATDGIRGMLGAPIDLSGLNLPKNDAAFIQELHNRGVLDLGQSAQLARAARGGSGRMQDAMKMASVTAQMAEMSNRLVMGLAAFRLAEKRPSLLNRETSTDYAIRALNLSMDNFDPSNTARAIGRHGFAGTLTPLFAQFQNYNLQTMQQLSRVVHDGLFNQDKSAAGLQRSAEAKREFAGLMATTAVLAGGLGLPFANAFAGVYNNLMSDPDDPKDVRISLRNWATNTFGKEVGDVLAHGVGGALGVDTSSFGLEGLLPGSDFLASRMLWKDRAETQATSMLGPAVSLGMDLGTAISKMSDGNYLKGIEAALPVGLRTYYKTAELAGLIGPGGYTDAKGNPLPIKAGASDVAWRALGFQTAEKADQGDAARDFVTNQQLLEHRRGVITDQFVKSVDNPDVLPSAMAALQAYNVKNPTQPIRDVSSAIRQHLQGLALGEASGTGVAATRRQFQYLNQHEQFAAMPRP